MRTKLIGSVATLAVLVLLVVLGGVDSVDSQEGGKATFKPTFAIKTTDSEGKEVAPTAEATGNAVIDFKIPKGDVQVVGTVAFIPKEVGIVPGDQIPVGTVVGTLRADAVLGLLNNACNQVLPVEFTFVNGSLDASDTVEFDDIDLSGQGEVFEDKDDNGLYDGYEKWPAFLNRVYPDIADKVIRRAVGVTSVAGVGVMLQFLIFPPGTEIQPKLRPEVTAIEPLFPETGDPALGYPTLSVLQDIGDPEIDPEPSAITDFCTPLSVTNIAFGTARENPDIDATTNPTAAKEIKDYAGKPVTIGPQDGLYNFQIIALGGRDADGDGLENFLDTCPLVVSAGDPRVLNDGDIDSDGLDAACDPDDNRTNSDEDLDGYLNRQDNCPLKENGQPEANPGQDNQKDIDLDSIGDVCDPEPSTPNGDLLRAVLSADIKVGTGEGPGGPPDCVKLGVTCWSADDVARRHDKPDASPGAGGGDDGGSNTGLIIGIVAAVAAAVVVVGGGAAVLMRRRNG